MARFTFRLVTVLACITFGSLFAQAQNNLRSWVSGVGTDNPNCSRTSPCRTIAFAISVTKSNGEILILDPGGYGTFTIDRSITIDANGVIASVSVSAGQNAINITLNPADPLNTVRLRGLMLTGMGDGAKIGLRGIHVTNTNTATNLKINLEDMVIDGFSQDGIFYNANGGDLIVKNSSIRNNNLAGIQVDSSDGSIAYLSLNQVSTDLNQEGVRIEDNVRATISHSVSQNNILNGYTLFPSTASSTMNIDHSTATNNKQYGVVSITSGAATGITRISDMEITDNVVGGLKTFTGGQICSNGRNRITTPTDPPNCTFIEQ